MLYLLLYLREHTCVLSKVKASYLLAIIKRGPIRNVTPLSVSARAEHFGCLTWRIKEPADDLGPRS